MTPLVLSVHRTIVVQYNVVQQGGVLADPNMRPLVEGHQPQGAIPWRHSL